MSDVSAPSSCSQMGFALLHISLLLYSFQELLCLCKVTFLTASSVYTSRKIHSHTRMTHSLWVSALRLVL